ncbi:hypothetical protein HD806DRAFT_518100 [Xylariaceae sp. AK1471]|nr:hypothetical protein HD806DRAFT_518100 [Xylariaceae sp. AK1471]
MDALAEKPRGDNGVQLWTTDIEASYHKEGVMNTKDSWDDIENEAFPLHEPLSLYTYKTSSYAALREYQGKIPPRPLAQVRFELGPPGVTELRAIDQAVQITRVLGGSNILNADVRPDNFLVAPTDNEGYHVLMIDFGQCRLCREHESNAN